MDNKKIQKDIIMIVMFPSGMCITGNTPRFIEEPEFNLKTVEFKTAKVNFSEIPHIEILKNVTVNLNVASYWFYSGGKKK